MNGDWQQIEKNISNTIGKNIQIINKAAISGGCINQCWKIVDHENHLWFVKTNLPTSEIMFQVEAHGLKEIKQSHTIRVPSVICTGSTSTLSYLVLEYVALTPLNDQTQFATQLAKMHSQKTNQFGWAYDNTIGTTHQSNLLTDNWVQFWNNERLLPQLELALKNGFPSDAYEEALVLSEKTHLLFSNTEIEASLLHGDLWSGNCASTKNGDPIIFDPAVYYGDRETDIAMSELFGGFNQDFYLAYSEHYPLGEGYKIRKVLYNLYHILNHFNLFGSGYLLQARNMTKKLLSEI